MPETIVHTAESAVDGTVTGIASAVGAVTNETAHQAEALTQHAAAIADQKDTIEWLKTRLEQMEAALTEIPSAAIAQLRSEIANLKDELTTQTAALSEAIVSQTPEEPQTDPPPAQPNPAQEAERKGPLGGLRKALHRLL